MKIRNFFAGICCGLLMCACGDDDKRDDTLLDMSYITGKDWYYNGWLGSKYEYGQNDLLQVIRFDKDNIWKIIEYSGRKVTAQGHWEKQGNAIVLRTSEEGEKDIWNVLHSGDDYMEVNINAVGTRSYTTDAGWLEDLTADAFYVNEWVNGEYVTVIGVDVYGNGNIREAVMISGEEQYKKLDNSGYHWIGSTGINGEIKEHDIRFYFRIGSGKEVKLKDGLEAVNMVKRTPEEVLLTAASLAKGKLKVQWNSYDGGETRKVYYKVEILPENMEEEKAWFVSDILTGTNELTISESTGGKVNKLKEKQVGEHYVVRLSALIFEEGVDVYDAYSYANVQAKTCFRTQVMVWQ